MKVYRSFFLALLGILALSTGVGAAVQCEMSETPVQCIKRSNQEAREAGEEALAADQANELAKKPTGVQTGGENLASNTTNFIPLLSLAGLLGDVQQGDTEGTYAVDLNFLIPGLSLDKNSKLQAVVNSQPKVADSISSQLPEDQRDELTEKLQAGLGDLSDYAVSLTYSWIDRRHGRGFEQYRNRFAALVEAVNANFGHPPSGAGLARVNAAIIEINKLGITGDLPHQSFDALAEKNADAAALLKAATEKGVEEELALLASDRQIWLDAGLGHFGDLLDNQPQLNFAAQKNFRDDVVGGNETTARVSYEWGRANLNRALHNESCRKELDTPATDTIDANTLKRCLTEYTKFINENKGHLMDGEKFSFSAEYRQADGKTFDVPSQGLTGLKLNAANKLVINVGYGRYFTFQADDAEPVRLDFVGSYEDVSDDPTRQDRGVATLTLTRKFGTISVPFGIVYANHGEFLGEVDEELSAHVGLKFDLGGLVPQPQEQ